MYGAKIASIRLARGYTQEFMAGQLGMAQNTYSKIEKDEKARIDDDLLNKIAGVLGVSSEDIKSPMPIIMNFHNSPYGGQFNTNNTINEELIQTLREQLQQKDEQIASLLALLKSK
jgi:transcriptional regulator with XRE-family HTH domain